MSLPEAAQPCRVLIVDDDELVLSGLSALVRLGGYETYTATSGAAALRILAASPCQILLTDWHMPDMDGLAFSVGRRAKGVAGHFDAPDDVRQFLAHLLDDERDATLP